MFQIFLIEGIAFRVFSLRGTGQLTFNCNETSVNEVALINDISTSCYEKISFIDKKGKMDTAMRSNRMLNYIGE